MLNNILMEHYKYDIIENYHKIPNWIEIKYSTLERQSELSE